jgi:hypothetical protein
MIPLVVAFGIEWGATGAGAAVLVSTVTFCVVWTVLLARIHRAPRRASAAVPPPAAVEAEAPGL